MGNSMMAGIGGLVEAQTRANLERDFGISCRPRAERLDDAGFGPAERRQQTEWLGLAARLFAAVLPRLSLASFRRAHG